MRPSVGHTFLEYHWIDIFYHIRRKIKEFSLEISKSENIAEGIFFSGRNKQQPQQPD